MNQERGGGILGMLFGGGRKSKAEEAMVITLLVACKGSLDIPAKVPCRVFAVGVHTCMGFEGDGCVGGEVLILKLPNSLPFPLSPYLP
jgi:hypothetical protein